MCHEQTGYTKEDLASEGICGRGHDAAPGGGGMGGGGGEINSLNCVNEGGRVSEVINVGAGMGGGQGGKERSLCILGEIDRAVLRYVFCV
jgi:hypothetical protein